MSNSSPSPRHTGATRQHSGEGRRRGEVGAQAQGAPAPWGRVEDIGRQQLAASTEAAAVLFRGSEAIRRIQQQAAHEASLRHQHALRKLQASADTDLVAVQSGLLRCDMEEAVRYWQQLLDTTLRTQVEILGCTTALFQSVGLHAFQDALQALQPVPGHLPDTGSAGS